MNLTETMKRFENHELTIHVNTDEIVVADFSKPKTDPQAWDLYQKWIIVGSTLIITGDCGAAVYQWERSNDFRIGLGFFKSMGITYFNEKCKADRTGESQRVFDADYATERMFEIVIERALDELIDFEPSEDFNSLSNRAKFDYIKINLEYEPFENIDDYEFNCDNIFEAYDFMQRNQEVFGSDTWENDLEKLSITPYFHLAALKVANEKYPDAF